MDKMKMQSDNLVNEHIEQIAKLFPNCITEAKDENGKLTRLVDFDLLKQELSNEVVEGSDERYTLNWAGKKQAILTANAPINATLRPRKDESVDFDNTKNLYIEGDNLDVLKLLRETYLGKVDLIYIDPPYNTGHDFIYEDDFAASTEEYLESSKSYDEQGNKLFVNNDSNGRFHSDWLSMMYSRLKIAKDLLSDVGSIFISIDDNEFENVVKLGKEIFGESKFVSAIPRLTSPQRSGQEDYMNVSHDYVVVFSYAKTFNHTKIRDLSGYNIKKDKNGTYIEGDTKAILAAESQGYSQGGDYDFEYNGKIYKPVTKDGKRNRWLWTRDRMEAAAKLGILVETSSTLRMQLYLDKRFEEGTNKLVQKDEKLIFHTADLMENAYSNPNGIIDADKLGMKNVFSAPKPVNLLKVLIDLSTQKDSLVVDFFSGSATTAHAVMQLNAEDGGNRKFIMVQLPELTDEKSEAYKAGYKNICEIGKERIRRAGIKVLMPGYKFSDSHEAGLNVKDVYEQYKSKDVILEMGLVDISKLDYGFRVLKLDSSCMKDVYYNPSEMSQDLLAGLEDNIKEDRTPEDLLFKVMLDMGVMLSSDIKTLDIKGKKVFNVNDGNLVCCFDKNLTDDVVTEIAKMKPLYAVFRDSSMATDSVNVNFDQIFETYSSNTTRKVI